MSKALKLKSVALAAGIGYAAYKLYQSYKAQKQLKTVGPANPTPSIDALPAPGGAPLPVSAFGDALPLPIPKQKKVVNLPDEDIEYFVDYAYPDDYDTSVYVVPWGGSPWTGPWWGGWGGGGGGGFRGGGGGGHHGGGGHGGGGHHGGHH